MADKKVNLIISLKDNVSSGLSKIRSGLSSTIDVFKKVGIAGVAMATTIVGGLTFLASKFMEVESAQNRLSATFQAAGENGKAAVALWTEYASAIQKVTTLDDEVVLGLVSTAKMMGVSNDKIADSIKGAIGLSKAFGIDLPAAMKMTVMAMAGNYAMLGRYIPAVREATTEGEKAVAVQLAMAYGWQIAKAETDTMQGALAQFKTTASDAFETAGFAIFGEGGFTGAIQKAREFIQKLIDDGSITTWAKGISSDLIAAGDAIQILFKGGDAADGLMKRMGAVVMGIFTDAVSSAINLLMKAAPVIGGALVDAISGGLKSFVTGGNKATWEQKGVAQESARAASPNIFSKEYRDAYQASIKSAEADNKSKAVGSSQTSLLSQYGLTTDSTAKARAELEDYMLKQVAGGGIKNILEPPAAKADPYGGIPAWQYQQQYAASITEGAGGLTKAAMSDQSGGLGTLIEETKTTNMKLDDQMALLSERLGGVE